MKRNIELTEISDGRLYSENDMVNAACRGCEGCSDCCGGMGDTITLDPYDLNRLYRGLSVGFGDLYGKGIGLTVSNGVILPHIMMDEKTDRCVFIDENGWCTIHKYRSGMCRLFPLARVYDGDEFKYTLLKDVCHMPHSKVKVNKWLDQENYPEYKAYLKKWHELIRLTEGKIVGILTCGSDEAEGRELVNKINMTLVSTFYAMGYGDDFYEDFYRRAEDFTDKWLKG